MTKEQEDKIIRQAQDILERRLGVREDIKVNLQNLIYYGAYYQGLRKGLTTALSIVQKPPKGDERIYTESELRLSTSSLRNAQLFDDGTQIRYRNHKHNKKGKLESVECFFVEYRNVITEVK